MKIERIKKILKDWHEEASQKVEVSTIYSDILKHLEEMDLKIANLESEQVDHIRIIQDEFNKEIANLENINKSEALLNTSLSRKLKVMEDRLSIQGKINDELVATNNFYADPYNNESEWLNDYSYYDHSPPTRATANCHGKRARETKRKVKEIESNFEKTEK